MHTAMRRWVDWRWLCMSSARSFKPTWDVGAGDLASDGRALSLSCVATLRRNCYSKTVSKCPRVPRVELLSGHLVVVVRLHLLRIQLQANPLHPIES